MFAMCELGVGKTISFWNVMNVGCVKSSIAIERIPPFPFYNLQGESILMVPLEHSGIPIAIQSSWDSTHTKTTLKVKQL